MKVFRIYVPDDLAHLNEIELNADTSHRLNSVLRLTMQDRIILFNGDGFEYSCIIQAMKKQRTLVQVIGKDKVNRESPLSIQLGQVISKGEKMDFVIQKATELGVHSMYPLFSKRSVVHLDEVRSDKKRSHWLKTAIHASEQCGRTLVPTIALPMDIEQWIQNCSEKTKLVLDPTASDTLCTLDVHRTIALLIGPEGGLTTEEIQYAKSHGFHAIRLGSRILRTETAALAAIAALQTVAGDFKV